MLHSCLKCFFITLICASIPVTVYVAVPDIVFPDNELFERLYQVYIIALCLISSAGLTTVYIRDKNRNHFNDGLLLVIEEQWISPNALRLCIFLSICSVIGYFGNLLWEFLFFYLVDCGNPIDINKKLAGVNFKFWCDVFYEISLIIFFICLIKHIKLVNTKKRQYHVPTYWLWLTMVTSITVFFKILLAHIKETVEALLHHHDHDSVDFYNCTLKQIEDYSGIFYAFPYITGLAYNGAAEFLPLAFFFLFEMDKLFRKRAHTSTMEWLVSQNNMHTFKSVLLSIFSFVSVIFAITLVVFFLFYIITKTDQDSDFKYQINLIIRMIFCFSLTVQAGISSSCLKSNYGHLLNSNVPEDNRLSSVVDTASFDVTETNENTPLLSHQDRPADAVICGLNASDNGRQDEAMPSSKAAPANGAGTGREHHIATIDHSKSYELDGKILFYSMLPVVSVLSSHVLCSLFFLFFLEGGKIYILFGLEAFVNVIQLWSQNYFLNNLLST